MVIAVVVDARAGNELHHEIGHPVLGGPAVKQTGDVWMREVRQHLPLVPEARESVDADQIRANEFHGNLLFELPIRTFCPVDMAHAAARNEFEKPIGADTAADHRIAPRLPSNRVQSEAAGPREKVPRLSTDAQERADLRRNRFILLCEPPKQLLLRGRIEFDRRRELALHALSLFSSQIDHSTHPQCSSRDRPTCGRIPIHA